MTPKERILGILRGDRSMRPVLWIPVNGTVTEGMDACGAAWPHAHWDPALMARLAEATYELTGCPTCTIPFCLTLEAEALGAGVGLGTRSTQPQVKRHLEVSMDAFTPPSDFLARGRIPVVLEAVERLARSTGRVQPVNMKIVGPFTLAAALFGAEALLLATIDDPEGVARLLDRLLPFSVELARAALARGADVITVPDPVASGDLISPVMYAELVLPAHVSLLSQIDAPRVLHICGDTAAQIPHIRRAGVHAFSFEEKVPVRQARAALGEGIGAIGNLSAFGALLTGSPDAVRSEARRCLADGIDVLSSGCGLSPLSPLDNVRALVEAVKEHEARP
ncbi:MAG: MtaA/CmuA family methyltransferase [Candidatus Rokubacteria bacterium]|nr:MtaA/CmuA family methyltransferase [Candidatus Rokubacteria bacterium]